MNSFVAKETNEKAKGESEKKRRVVIFARFLAILDFQLRAKRGLDKSIL